MTVQETKIHDDTKQNFIEEFFENFQQELHRSPTLQELMDNLVHDKLVKNTLNITEEMLNDFIKMHESL